jgi:hypothetical protein
VVLAYVELIDEDLEGSNNGVVELQEVQNVSATKRSPDPVPRTTLNDCGLSNTITFVNNYILIRPSRPQPMETIIPQMQAATPSVVINRIDLRCSDAHGCKITYI